MNNKQLIRNKTLLITFVSFYIAAIITFIVGYLITFLPNELDEKFIVQNFIHDISNFCSNKINMFQYIICTCTFVIAYFFSYLFLRKKEYKNIDTKNEFIMIFSFVILSMIFIATNFYHPFYLDSILSFSKDRQEAVVTLSIISLLLMFIIMLFSKCQANLKTYKYLNFFYWATVLFIVCKIASLYVVRNYYQLARFTSYHFDAYYYPVYKVFCGQTPLIDFNCLYGFYPYFIVPVLSLFSNCGMYSFSIFMCILVLLMLISVAFVINSLCKNKMLSFISLLAIIYIVIIFPMTFQGGPFYLQYVPHRVISPSIILAICVLYLKSSKTKLKKIIYYTGWLFIACALLWNIDTGVVLLISYVSFYMYQEACRYKFNDKKLYIKFLKIILLAMFSVVLFLISLIVITFCRTHKLLTLQNILYGQSTFYKYGFFMIPTPFMHQWILLVCVYAIALAKSIRNLKCMCEKKTEDNFRSSIYFLLSVVGIGVFSYYNGRSHDFVFSAVIWPAIILLAGFCQESLERIVVQKNSFDIFKFISILLLQTCFASCLLINLIKPDVIQDVKNKNIGQDTIIETVNFIKENKQPNETIDIIMDDSAAMYSILRDKKIPNVPARIDWFTKDDISKVSKYLIDSNNKLFIDINTYNLLNSFDFENFSEIFNNNYNLINRNPSEKILVFSHK